MNEIDKGSLVRPSVVAVTNTEEYKDPRVAFKLSQHDQASYYHRAFNQHQHQHPAAAANV